MSSLLATKPRYELKYLVEQPTVDRLLDFLAGQVEEEPNARGGGYQVTSLYFDTVDFDAYFEKLDGVDPRYKVRVRYYGEVAPSKEDGGEATATAMTGLAAFVEIKHRHGSRVHKDRVRIPGSAVAGLAAGHALASDLGRLAGGGNAVVERLIRSRPRQPIVRVSYHRRAYRTRLNPTLRITLDNHLRALGPGRLPVSAEDGEIFLPPHLTVVEIKFHFAMPLWLLGICRELGMVVRRYSKYGSAIERLYPAVAQRAVRMAPAGTPVA